MTAVLIIVLMLLFATTGIAAFQWAEARRWRTTAGESLAEAEQNRDLLEQARGEAIENRAEATKHRELAEMQLKLLTQTHQQLEEKFNALAADALQRNSQLFLDRSREQIQHAVEPVSESLKRFEQQVQAIEVTRQGAYQSITAQVNALTELQERVRLSTEQLKTALRSPIQRGRWGELQLRRVVEMAGMLEYCDFAEQETLFGERNQRPDLIVRLPNGCRVIVDSKVSLEAYLRAIESQDETDRQRFLNEHARQVKTHVKALGEKSYWERLPCSPDFVIAFLPLESLFSAALDSEPALLDFGVARKVVLATPSTLIALLLTVAYGWRQQELAVNVEKIRDAGKELYTRLLTMYEHFNRLGSAIEKAVSSYNDAASSLEKRVLPMGRRLKELQPGTARELEDLEIIEATPKTLDAAKWLVNS
jgi:DNA recombination protein RmuC